MKRMLYVCSFACILSLTGCPLWNWWKSSTPEETEELQKAHDEKREAQGEEAYQETTSSDHIK